MIIKAGNEAGLSSMLFGPRTVKTYNHEKSASNTISINILDLFFLLMYNWTVTIFQHFRIMVTQTC